MEGEARLRSAPDRKEELVNHFSTKEVKLPKLKLIDFQIFMGLFLANNQILF